MKIGMLFATAALAASGLAHADTWKVDVVFWYLDGQMSLVDNVPVGSFKVPVDKCTSGVTRADQISATDSTVTTQRLCVSTTAQGNIRISGWVFPQEPVLKPEPSHAIYGDSVDLETDGAYVRATSGHYRVIARRIGGG